ncbi:hypothetical protein CVT24_012963 [Panaeolus cyanescens]|uniref:F-box domain-containing protein n=1 Tax=Panaeolus cyanescens TaxID=181874 RepID=A0A409WWS6_9AGAR|nr:hypothetical protein CVT24_012963 [Panaeolus cyanescens]
MAFMLLTDIPPDVLLRIFALLDLKDLVSLRKTCKTLLSLSHEKTIWLRLADRLCTEYLLFPSSFPPQSLESAVLEDIVTRPVRWEKLVQQEEVITPVSTRKLSSASVFKDNGFHNFLVPGGRFLLACYEHPPRLALLDLNSTNPEIPLDTLTISERSVFSFIPSPDSSKGTFSICVHTKHLFDVYDVSPYEKDCKFAKVASCDSQLVSAAIHTPEAVSADTVVFTDGTWWFFIWNFRLDKWIKCAIRYVLPIFKVFLLHDSDSIALKHHDSFSVCPIPIEGYVSRPGASDAIPEVTLGIRSIRRFIPGLYFGLKQATNDWYSGTKHNTLLSARITSTKTSVMTLRFYDVEHDKDTLDLSPSPHHGVVSIPNQPWATICMPCLDENLPVPCWKPCNDGLYSVSNSPSNPAHINCQGVKALTDGIVQASSALIDLQIPDITNALHSPPEVKLQILYERVLSPPPNYGFREATDDWYSGSKYHTTVAVSSSTQDSMMLLRFYNIEHEVLQCPSSSNGIPPNHSWATIQTHPDRSASSSRWIPCNNGIYRISQSRFDVAHFDCYGLKSLSNGAVQTSNAVINLRNAIPDIPDDARARILVCPHSGRACMYYSSPRLGSNSPGEGVIFVLDLFEPLPVPSSSEK